MVILLMWDQNVMGHCVCLPYAIVPQLEVNIAVSYTESVC